MHHLSPQHLQALLDQHMRSTLNQYEHQRIASTQPLSTDDVENGSLAWDYLAKDTQDQLARNDYGRVKLSTDVLLEENAIKLDPSSIEYRRVCRELLKTEARLIHIEQQRTQGKYEQPLESEVVTQVQPVISPTGSGSVSSAMSADSSTPHNLSTLIQAYVDEHKNTCWTEKTEAEYVAILNLFMSIVGDLPLAVLNAQTILHFRKIVSQLPANMNKLKQFKGKSIEAILALPDVKPMSRSNANKYLIRVSQLLKWAHELDYIHKNFAENKTLPSEKQPDKQRDAFTTDDIKTIFHNEEYSNPTLRGASSAKLSMQ